MLFRSFVCAADLDSLIALHRADRQAIVALKSGDAWGTPMLLPSSVYTAVPNLRGDAGAKRIAQRPGARVRFVSALSPFAFADADTRGDLERLAQMEPRT